jgi:hypothetical protein
LNIIGLTKEEAVHRTRPPEELPCTAAVMALGGGGGKASQHLASSDLRLIRERYGSQERAPRLIQAPGKENSGFDNSQDARQEQFAHAPKGECYI